VHGSQVGVESEFFGVESDGFLVFCDRVGEVFLLIESVAFKLLCLGLTLLLQS